MINLYNISHGDPSSFVVWGRHFADNTFRVIPGSVIFSFSPPGRGLPLSRDRKWRGGRDQPAGRTGGKILHWGRWEERRVTDAVTMRLWWSVASLQFEWTVTVSRLFLQSTRRRLTMKPKFPRRPWMAWRSLGCSASWFLRSTVRWCEAFLINQVYEPWLRRNIWHPVNTLYWGQVCNWFKVNILLTNEQHKCLNKISTKNDVSSKTKILLKGQIWLDHR